MRFNIKNASLEENFIRMRRKFWQKFDSRNRPRAFYAFVKFCVSVKEKENYFSSFFVFRLRFSETEPVAGRRLTDENIR